MFNSFSAIIFNYIYKILNHCTTYILYIFLLYMQYLWYVRVCFNFIRMCFMENMIRVRTFYLNSDDFSCCKRLDMSDWLQLELKIQR